MVVLLSAALLAAGCTAPGDVDNADSNVIFSIEEIIGQGGGVSEHRLGDVITNGVILDDTVTVILSAVLKAPIANSPLITRPDLQNISLERYEVTFTRTDGGTATPPGFTRGVSGLVRLSAPGGENVEGLTLENLVLVPSTIKAQPPLSHLIEPGIELGTNFANIQVDARIQFFGRTISGHDVTVVGNIGLNFADYGDPDS